MSQKIIDVGTIANDGTGDPLRNAFVDVNDNFTEVYDVVLANKIIVTQENKDTTLGGTIDSTKEYFLDGIINMGSTFVTVPLGGINIKGYDFNISGLTSTEDNYTLFQSSINGSGDIYFQDFNIDVSGLNSRVFNLNNPSGFNAVEIIRLNFNNCSSLGVLTSFRQGFETGTGRFGGTPELTLDGAWIGGYVIDSSIVRGLTNGSYSLFKAGGTFLMSSRFKSNTNIDLATDVSFLNFSESNFQNPSTLQLLDCVITRNGVFNPSDANITPNITSKALASVWRNNVGMTNTFVGGDLAITGESATVITGIDVFADLEGVFLASDLEHFDNPSGGQLRHLADSPREFKIIISLELDANQGDTVELKIVAWDDSESSFVDYKSTKRVVNNFQGGRDVAFFNVFDNIILDRNDYVKLQVANNTSTNNITAELGGEILIEER